MTTADSPTSSDFIRTTLAEDQNAGRGEPIVTRFPPEPNGYLHIGHAKSIHLNFGVAAEFAGRCHLRFDDTNPTRDYQKFLDAIRRDVRWLGFDWGAHEYYASSCFDTLYEWARTLIRADRAYVDDQSAEQIRQRRGTLTRPGEQSPCRDRPAEESLDLLSRMKAGEFAEGEKVLRARIDMASPNINLRDPVMYRILRVEHPRTGDAWCIYPTYDWAHGQCDWIEGVTHSLCSLEFEDHRPLYDWFIETLREVGVHPRSGSGTQPQAATPPPDRPHQHEFARLNLTHTLMSKRKLAALVHEGHVADWDDPRMPTLSGMRRRGFTADAIRDFCRRIGIAKRENVIEVELLEHCVRQDLNARALRVMGVLDPLKVVLTNHPAEKTGPEEVLEAVNNPEDESAGTRPIPFSRELYIERADFMEDPPRKFKRLSPGAEVRLRYGYFITCQEAIKDETGHITELRCTYDPETHGGSAPDGRKPKGTIHWVSAPDALEAEVRLYDHLFTPEDPDETPEGEDWRANLNPDSLTVLKGARVEPSLAEYEWELPVQFERQGYYKVDEDSTPSRLVFNRTVSLKDTWTKMRKSGKAG